MKINYHNLEKKINFKFKNINLLTQSLTHKSFDSNKNNEKIEFLGDRVLGLVIAKKLLEIYPDEKEGILDKKFASLVNKKTCLEIAQNINLDKFILTFNPNNKKVKIEDKIISDSCEALIGAVYLDKGFNVKVNYKPNNKLLPTNVALGLDDFAGTGFFSREYIVGTYDLNSFKFTLGLGWGKYATENAFSNPFSKIITQLDTRPNPNLDICKSLCRII